MGSSTPKGPRNRPPWTLLLACTVLLIGSNALLTFYHHHQQHRLLLASGGALLESVARGVQHTLDQTHRGPAQALNLLALDPLWQANTLDRRLRYLKKLAQILNDQPHLNSIYLSWEDGDFLLLRPLVDAEMRQRFEAPDDADWLLWHITSLAGQREAEHRFYNEALRLVTARPVPLGGFDPHLRPWHQLASRADPPNAQVVTPPYVFHSTGEFGISVAQRGQDNLIIGADITLDRLSARLAGYRLTPGSELLLYDGEGTVIAYHDALRIRNTAHGSALRLRSFQELGSTLLARLAEDGHRIERQGSLTLEGERWLVRQQAIRLPGLEEAFLAILVPERELLAEARELPRHHLLIALLTCLAVLILIWLGGWLGHRRRL